MISALDLKRLHAGRFEPGSEQHVIQLDARPLEPAREGEIRAGGLNQTCVLESGLEQRAEARMVGARVEIAHNDDDIAIADGFCTASSRRPKMPADQSAQPRIGDFG